jgi:hypothetical protein
VPIANLHNAGEFKKYINVTTNAKNNPNFRLSIGGDYHPLIEMEPSNSWRLLSQTGKDTGTVVTIKTPVKDLKITDVQFKENGKELDWKSNIPITYSLALVDSDKEKKDTVSLKGKKPADKAGKEPAKKAPVENSVLQYKLRLGYVPFSKTEIYGEFILKTNNKDKPEIKVSGTLEAKKE